MINAILCVTTSALLGINYQVLEAGLTDLDQLPGYIWKKILEIELESLIVPEVQAADVLPFIFRV